MIDTALDYAARGWPVLPLWWPLELGRCACPLGDRCDNPGKHPHGSLAPHGLNDATLDPDIIRSWWTTTPALNVGLRAGIAFDVLDLDNRDAGMWLAHYAHEHGAVTPECWEWGPMSLTGKGEHLLYAPTGAGNRSKVAKVVGFDWRGAGGYIVAPPSRHHTGTVYRWHEHCGPDAPIPPAPQFLVDLIVRPSPPPSAAAPIPAREYVGWSGSGLIAKMATATEGERNEMLNWAALKVGNGVADGKITQSEALAVLDDLEAVALRAGLGEHETVATIRSGYTAGASGIRTKGST